MMNKKIPAFRGIVILLLSFCFVQKGVIAQVSSNESKLTYNQKVEILWNSDPSISIELDNITLNEALIKIAKQAKVGLYFDSSLIPDKKISLDIQRKPLSAALNELLAGTRLEAYTSGRNIMLREKEIVEDDPAASEENEEMQELIEGRIVDAVTGEALPGVNILIEGTSAGTSTDIEGRFSLTLSSLDETLVITYIGYQRLVEPVAGRTEINVGLQPSAITGDDIVVTALGIDRQARALGYSVARVEPEAMTVNRTPNFMDALQGKMAGVNVSSMGTGPQGSSKIRIRGQSSFGGNNSPLIVVNGVPIDNTNFGVGGDISDRGTSRNSDSGDGLSSINPDDIEEMTVLKGASAAALYGSRAKDGVIMITTKNRAEGTGIEVDYNSNFTTSRAMDHRDYQMDYGQGENGQRPTTPGPTSGQWSFGEKFEPGMTHILFDGLEVPYEAQPNQLREYYRDGYNLSNTITVSQGGEFGGFSLSYSNLNSQAILPDSDYDRNSLSLGFTQSLADRLTFSGNINYSREDRTNPPNIHEQDYSPVVIYNLATSMPMSVLKDNAFTEEGDEPLWSRFTNRTNPYFALSRFENNTRDRVFGNLTTRFDITDWIFIQGRIGQDYFSRSQDYNLPTGSQRQPPAPPGFVNGQYVQDQLRSREINADFLVSARRNFGNYGVDLNLGGNQMHSQTDRNNVLVQDFFTRGLYSLGNGRSLDPQQNMEERQVNSLYGSSELSYRGLLFLTGTLRNDWFSTLSPENRSILYPSVTASFVFSDAFESELPDWLSFGKIRASYAEVGSDTDVPPYANNLFYGINSNLFRNQPLGGISGSIVPNPDLRPMRVSEWEGGLEMTLFENLSLEVAYYYKLSTDQILNQQISNISGFTSQLINMGESENRGVEMLVDFSPVRSENFFWNVNVNAAHNLTKVLDLGDDIGIDHITVGNAEFHGELRQVTGQPMNQLYGYGYLRDDEGRMVFNPENGTPMRSENQLSLGSSIPTWTGGITNSFNYRNLSMSFLIDFKLGHKLISGTHINAYRHGLDKATLEGREQGYIVGDGVNPDGSVNTVQAGVQAYYETIRTHRMSEQSVFNAGSWQLRQITVGYDFTRHLPEGIGLRRVVLSAVANNVAVLKKWVPHIHPDQNGFISDRSMGLEATGLPVTRSIGFNLNVGI
ncbi:MAG: SusC/RagA family TonB-linked outer membrane protein [Balneolaceae bacterium]